MWLWIEDGQMLGLRFLERHVSRVLFSRGIQSVLLSWPERFVMRSATGTGNPLSCIFVDQGRQAFPHVAIGSLLLITPERSPPMPWMSNVSLDAETSAT